ncbi:MAG: hydroxymethylbilane synthase [Chloracidobacterium sp.]|uniref:Porphobilinogen deaminase n=1 Tax=Chloracidobacterium validum TaxID=2821543 RepID=A0ABX8B7T8_9BACT|nr:hydroxymethylbilane synthase [Chloracidobacterium validum]QUW03008.1 hydroxymethylbilane synthase [Chloracidobacterium validum]
MNLTVPTTRLDADLIIGSRGSALALWQSEWVKSQLEQAVPTRRVAIQIIKTTGDAILDAPLSKIGGKGVFTKEIEEALLAGVVDLAVHSLKDLPTRLPAGLTLGCVTRREDVRDALVAREGVQSLDDLPPKAVIGTSSLRRQAQLLARRPDLELADLRGNVGTRLQRVAEGRYDAIILASAGLVRLGFESRIAQRIPTDVLLPAVGQGALGIEIREHDSATQEAVQVMAHQTTWRACEAERAFLHGLGGGCQVPIAAHAVVDNEGRLRLRGLVARTDGTRIIQDELTGDARFAEDIGKELAEQVLGQGADELLAELDAHPH